MIVRALLALPVALFAAGVAPVPGPAPATRPATAHAGPATDYAAPASSAPDDSVLAVFQGGAVYPSEFVRSWNALLPPERPEGDPADARRRFAVRIVDRMLLAREARSHAFTLTPSESLEFRRSRGQILQNALFFHLLEGEPPGTPEDLERYRRQVSELARIRFIEFPDEQTARLWRFRLQRGTPMSALDAAIEAGGERAPKIAGTSFVASESIPDTLAQVIWALRPGQVSEVHLFGGHATLIHATAFEPRIPTVDVRNPVDLERAFNRRRMDRLRERFRAELAADLDRRFVDQAMDDLLARHQALPPRHDVDSLTGTPVMRATLPVPPRRPMDDRTVLARLSDGELTIADYLTFWAGIPALARPEVRTREALESAVDRVAFGNELVRRAEAAGLERDSSVVADLARLHESFALDHLYVDRIVNRVPMDEKRLRAYFASRPGHYDDAEALEGALILLSRQSQADSIMALLRAGAPFDSLARAESMDGTTGLEGGHFGTMVRGRNDRNFGLEEAMFNTPVGSLGGPELTPEGWVIWRVDAIHPRMVRTFEDAREWVERDYRVIESERLLEEYLKELRSKAKVRVFEDRITAEIGT